jgi:hypothetical protein
MSCSGYCHSTSGNLRFLLLCLDFGRQSERRNHNSMVDNVNLVWHKYSYALPKRSLVTLVPWRL